MATVILDLSGTLPQSFTDGNWPRTTFNTLKYRLIWTPTAANTDPVWSGDFYALMVSSGTPSGNDTGGLWITADAVELYNQTGLLISRPITWGASAAITITVDMAAGSITISGASTGNGTFAFTVSGTVFTAGTLGVGVYGGGGFTLPASTIGDVDDGNDGLVGVLNSTLGALTSSASGSSSLNGSVTQTLGSLSSSATGQVAIQGLTSSTLGSLTCVATTTTDSAGTLAQTLGALTASAQGQVAISGSLTKTLGSLTLSATNVEGVILGVYGANRVLFGTPAGFVTVTLTTATAGSTFLITTGGNSLDLNTAPTDNKGNTYTSRASQDYHDWPGYGIRVWACENAAGGSSHTFSQQFGQTLAFDECTITVVEVKNGLVLQAIAINHPDNGQALTSSSITSTGPAVWIGFWSGDAPTGATSSISWNNGFQSFDETTLVDHPNGYVPIAIGAILATDFTPTTRSFTVTESPDQGSINVIAVVQASQGRLGLTSTTLGSLTSSATGQVESAGVLSKTLASLTCSSTGQVQISGIAASTLSTLTLSASGSSESNTGTLSSILGSLASSAQGQVAISGSASNTLAALASSAQGTIAFQGSTTSTLGVATCTASGQVAIQGLVNTTLDSLTCLASSNEEINGSLTQTLISLTCQSVGFHEIAGSLTSTLASMTCLASVSTDLFGFASIALGSMDLTAGGGDTLLVNLSIGASVNLRDVAPVITLQEG